jgi:hypothetical protein
VNDDGSTSFVDVSEADDSGAVDVGRGRDQQESIT